MPRAGFGLPVFVAEIEELALFVLVDLGLGFGPQDGLRHERFALTRAMSVKPSCRAENRVLESGASGF